MGNGVKKPKIWLHVFVGILVGLILCLGVGFVLYTQDFLQFSTSSEEDNTNSNAEVPNEANTSEDTVVNLDFDFDSTKVINSNVDGYTLTIPDHADGINISLDDTQMKATVSVNRNLVNQSYALGWVTATEDYVYEPHEISFDQKVVDIFFGGIGQGSSGDTILFLMEDGSVQYIPVRTALSTNLDNLNSYGALPSLSNIVKFYEANSYIRLGGGSNTILAQDKDGNIYDLSSILRETGNY